VPEKLLIIGDNIINLKITTIYHALNSKINVIELMDQIIPDYDKDLVTPLQHKIKKQYDNL
jgi:Pyruvate/2-oxoglutarate dehydrogenase complex, dihydrolipoamide dehydrogenase (E3) component, and related enzymes